MANDAKNNALSTLRGILVANEGKARMFGLGDTLKAVDAVLCEQARNQRTLANAVAVIADRLDMLDMQRTRVFSDNLSLAIRDVFYAGEGL